MAHPILNRPFRQLTHEEEQEAFERMRNGDQAARQLLIESQLGWLWRIAKKVAGLRTSLIEDLFQTGVEALILAIESFDPERGYRLSTFCYRRVAGLMLEYKNADSPITRPPRRSPSHSEEWDRAGVTCEVLQIGDERQRREAPDHEELCRLQDAIANLPPEHEAVIRARLEEKDYREISEELGIGVEQARQLERRAIHLLRTAMCGSTVQLPAPAELPLTTAAASVAG